MSNEKEKQVTALIDYSKVAVRLFDSSCLIAKGSLEGRKSYIKVTPITSDENCKISPIKTTFPADGALAVRRTKVCNFVLLKEHGVKNSDTFHDWELTSHVFNAKFFSSISHLSLYAALF